MGNLTEQSWQEIIGSHEAMKAYKDVSECSQNCWMVTTARTAMRSDLIHQFPKMKPIVWVVFNKLKLMLNMGINFDRYINYENVKTSPKIKGRTI